MEWDEKTTDTVHDENNIRGFSGEYRWLSNFHPCKVIYGGLTYQSSEAAYQAAKTDDEDVKEQISHMTASESKKVGKNGIVLKEEWDEVRYWEMHNIIRCKFEQNKDLRDKLLATGEKYLEETNWWNDTYWGVCNGRGDNELGNILMAVRNEIREAIGNPSEENED